MANDFAPPPALEPTPPAGVRRAEFRERVATPRRRGVPRWAWIAISAGVVAIAAGVTAAVIVDARAAALAPAAPGTVGRLHSPQVIAGMCLTGIAPTNGPAGTVTVVPCDQSHAAEVLAAYPFTSGQWPGAARVQRTVLDFCAAQVGPYGALAHAVTGRTWVVWVPSERTWAAGDRTGLCLVTSKKPWTGHATDSLVGQPA